MVNGYRLDQGGMSAGRESKCGRAKVSFSSRGYLVAATRHIHLAAFGLLLSAIWLVLVFACIGKIAVVRRLGFFG